MSTKTPRGLGLVYLRGRTWWIQFSIRGRVFRETSHSPNVAVANRLLKQRISEGQAGKPIGPEIERTTLEDLFAMLLNDYRAHGRKSIDRVEDAIIHLREFFTDARANEISSDRVVAFVAHRLSETYQNHPVSRATVNYELAMLSRAFRLADDAGKVAGIPKTKKLHVDNARKGFFEPEQYRDVVKNLPAHLRPLAQALYITGWRVNELLSRQWRHVDLNEGWLRLDPGESKNGQGREFPLTPELQTILTAQREYVRSIERRLGRVIPWLFIHEDGSPVRDFRYSWHKACRAAGVPGRLVHDFRRTAVRNLERAGVPRSAAMKMTGHLTQTIYDRYAITDSAMLKDAAVKLAVLHANDK